MKRMGCPYLALLLCLLALGCGGKGADSPEQAVKLHVERMKAGDVDGMWELTSETMRQQLKVMKAQVLTMPDAELQKEFGLDKAAIEDMSVLEFMKAAVENKGTDQVAGPVGELKTEMQGEDRAVVRFEEEKGGKCFIPVINDGGWKVDGPATCKRKMVKEMSIPKAKADRRP